MTNNDIVYHENSRYTVYFTNRNSPYIKLHNDKIYLSKFSKTNKLDSRNKQWFTQKGLLRKKLTKKNDAIIIKRNEKRNEKTQLAQHLEEVRTDILAHHKKLIEERPKQERTYNNELYPIITEQLKTLNNNPELNTKIDALSESTRNRWHDLLKLIESIREESKITNQSLLKAVESMKDDSKTQLAMISSGVTNLSETVKALQTNVVSSDPHVDKIVEQLAGIKNRLDAIQSMSASGGGGSGGGGGYYPPAPSFDDDYSLAPPPPPPPPDFGPPSQNNAPPIIVNAADAEARKERSRKSAADLKLKKANKAYTEELQKIISEEECKNSIVQPPEGSELSKPRWHQKSKACIPCGSGNVLVEENEQNICKDEETWVSTQRSNIFKADNIDENRCNSKEPVWWIDGVGKPWWSPEHEKCFPCPKGQSLFPGGGGKLVCNIDRGFQSSRRKEIAKVTDKDTCNNSLLRDSDPNIQITNIRWDEWEKADEKKVTKIANCNACREDEHWDDNACQNIKKYDKKK